MTQSYPYKVSVLIVSFNHQQFLGEAIESVISQDIDFPVEIVVADDCSMDGTLEVVRKYQRDYPDRIRILDHDTNVGITRNYQRGFKMCTGEYIAVLEGDDCWLGNDRLKTMVKFLDEHCECALAFNRILYLNSTTPACQPLQWDTNLSFELKSGSDLAYRNFIGNFSACVYRTSAIKRQPDTIYDLKMYDWLFNLSLARFGLIAYLPVIRSVYRQHGEGTWSGMSGKEQLAEMLQIIPVYDQFLQGVYSPQFNAYLNELQMEYGRVCDADEWRKHKGNPFILGWIAVKRVFRKIKRRLQPVTRLFAR